VLDLQARRFERSTKGGGIWDLVSWSADSETVYVERFADGRKDIMRVSRNGGAEIAVRMELGSHHEIVSPKGDRLAFTHGRDIWVMNLDGTGRRNLTRTPGIDSKPSWSPDGKSIAFHSDRGGNYDIYVVDCDSGSVRRLTDDPGYDCSPLWSPNGDAIAFQSTRRFRGLARALSRDSAIDAVNIFVMKPDGSSVRGLTQRGSEARFVWGHLEWSHDGRWLLNRGPSRGYGRAGEGWVILAVHAATPKEIRLEVPGIVVDCPFWLGAP
jgi:TolB protein